FPPCAVKCGSSAMRRKRSPMHSMRSGIAAPMNEARLRMTRIPRGASSTKCHGAPRFRKCNRDGAGETRGRGRAGANGGEHNPDPRPFTAKTGVTRERQLLQIFGKRAADRAGRESVMLGLSWAEKLHQAEAEFSERRSDPWRAVLERALPPDVT